LSPLNFVKEKQLNYKNYFYDKKLNSHWAVFVVRFYFI